MNGWRGSLGLVPRDHFGGCSALSDEIGGSQYQSHKAWVSPPTIDRRPTGVPGLKPASLEDDVPDFRQLLGAAFGIWFELRLGILGMPWRPVRAMKVKAGL